MNVSIDSDACLGCRICQDLAPDVFHLGRRVHSVVRMNPVPQRYWKAVRAAVEQCPEEAISIEEDEIVRPRTLLP